MKIEIDFDNKVITVKSECKISDLIAKLKSLKIKFEEYSIKTQDEQSGGGTITWPVIYPWTTQPPHTLGPYYDSTGTKPYDPPYKVTCQS